MTTKTCPTCGIPLDSPAFQFLHARYHAGKSYGVRSSNVEMWLIRSDELIGLMQEYAEKFETEETP